jgi:transitional endoplasmic reticulum ATPase
MYGRETASGNCKIFGNIMDEIDFTWRMLGSLTRVKPARSPLAVAVMKWVKDNKKTLGIRQTKGGKLTWAHIGLREKRRKETNAEGALYVQLGKIAEALQLDELDHQLLWFILASSRFELPRGLAEVMMEHLIEPALLWAEHLGAHPGEARQRITRGDLERLGLIRLKLKNDGLMGVESNWTLDRLLDQAMNDACDPIEMLVGTRQKAALPLSSFGRVTSDIDLIVRLIKGALAKREKGINILFYGPPGTGKTELARSLAIASGGQLFSVGEADEYGEEPSRWDRVTAYRIAQRVAQRRTGITLLFDEMEDLIGDAQPSYGDSYRNREGSKIYVNRLLETNAAPTIWTTNAIDNMDPAILRRMSYVLKMDYPTPHAAEAMTDHIASEEQVEINTGLLRRLTSNAPQAATIMRSALRVARLSEGGEVEADQAAQTLLSALNHGQMLRLPQDNTEVLDLALYDTDQDIQSLCNRLSNPETPNDFSLLLTGPPGTGKTVLAHHLAYRLDRPLIVKRASDLLSKWVGGTEKQIAGAFEEALDRQGVLLFDEVDSLLLDRSMARHSWEVTQVNELLTCFDRHPLPFIAATNHASKLDAAALRRFVFKLDFRALSNAKLRDAYQRFFKRDAPQALCQLEGLTPGDFAVVARQLRYIKGEVNSLDILKNLQAELASKPHYSSRIGF